MAGKRSRIPKYGTVEIKGHTYYRTTITDMTLMHILKLTLVCTDLDLAQKIRIKSLQLFL